MPTALTKLMTSYYMKLINWKIFAAVAFLVAGSPASAYIDPNVGSQIFQLFYPIIALILGLFTFCRQWVVVVIGRTWRTLRDFVSRVLG